MKDFKAIRPTYSRGLDSKVMFLMCFKGSNIFIQGLELQELILLMEFKKRAIRCCSQ